MDIFITGGCGFIGSYLARKLLVGGHNVTVFDNMSVGSRKFLGDAAQNVRCRIVKGDVARLAQLKKHMKGHDFVYHLAANANIPLGVSKTKIDLEANLIGTYNVLEAMHRNKIEPIAFTSSSAVYGEPPKSVGAVTEDYGSLVPISFYGASKLGAEAYVSAFHHMFGLRAWTFRFANVVGPNGTHGVIKDFIIKLRTNSQELEVLGDGKQEKSFIYVEDCVNAMVNVTDRVEGNAQVFNLGSVDTIMVDQIAEIVLREMGLQGVRIIHAGGDRGWAGDVPYVFLDITKLRKVGFAPKFNSAQAVTQAVREMLTSFTTKIP